VNLYGFIGPEIFLTKTGELGLVLEVRGVDYECLDGASIDALTKRLESELKLFGDDYRVYQYLLKRNNETIPYKLYGNQIVDAATQNRIAYLGSKANTLFSLSIHYVILQQGSQISHSLGNALVRCYNTYKSYIFRRSP
jgi:type IV secretion system protein TrbE